MFSIQWKRDGKRLRSRYHSTSCLFCSCMFLIDCQLNDLLPCTLIEKYNKWHSWTFNLVLLSWQRSYECIFLRAKNFLLHREDSQYWEFERLLKQEGIGSFFIGCVVPIIKDCLICLYNSKQPNVLVLIVRKTGEEKIVTANGWKISYCSHFWVIESATGAMRCAVGVCVCVCAHNINVIVYRCTQLQFYFRR